MRYIIMVLALLAMVFAGCSIEDKTANNPDVVIDIPGDDVLPDPNDFVPVEKLPEMIYEEIPEYPQRAFEAGIEGHVFIQAYVNKEGIVRKAEAVRCSNPGWGFERAAVRAAYKCRYNPAVQNGQPIGVWITYKADFVIG